MSTKPLTDFIADFVAEQAEREQLAQLNWTKECETILASYQHAMTSALGVAVLAALEPDWSLQKAPANNYAQMVLHYKGETFTLKDAPGQRVEQVRKTVAALILEVDEEQRDFAVKRVKLAATLMTRPLPDHVTSSWWNRIQHIVGDDAGLLNDWDAAMVIFDERVQEAKAQEEKRREAALKVSKEFMLEIVADIENSDDERHVKDLREAKPALIAQSDRRIIQEAGFVRLQELDREYEQQQEAQKERILQIERANFWPFHFYMVFYQVGVSHEEGFSMVETESVLCFNSECTEAGWWFAAEGRRVRLPFVSKIVEYVVRSPADFWPKGMWEVKETDDGLEYRVPFLLAVRADACAQAKEV